MGTFLIMLNNLRQMRLELLQKEQLKNSRTTGDLIGNKIADKSQESQKLHHRIIEKQMKKKC